MEYGVLIASNIELDCVRRYARRKGYRVTSFDKTSTNVRWVKINTQRRLIILCNTNVCNELTQFRIVSFDYWYKSFTTEWVMDVPKTRVYRRPKSDRNYLNEAVQTAAKVWQFLIKHFK